MKKIENAETDSVKTLHIKKYLHLSKTVYDRERVVLELEEELEKILRSKTYKFWQTYCAIKKRLFRHPDGRMFYHHDDSFDYVEEDYQKDVVRLKKKQALLLEQEEILRTILDKIYFSKTYRLVSYYWRTKDSIKIFFKESRYIRVIYKIIPASIKKLFRKSLRSLVSKSFGIRISNEIYSEWDVWNTKRSDNSFDVFIFGITAFDFRFQRPQQFSQQFVNQGNRVFYIENSFLPVNPDNTSFPIEVKKVGDGIYSVVLPATKNMSIYTERTSKKDIELMIGGIKTLIREASICNPIVKIDHPFWTSLSKQLSMHTIYDCMDEHAGFEVGNKDIDELESEMVSLSDVVFAASKKLYRKMKKQSSKKTQVTLLPNGCDFQVFSSAIKKTKDIPKDIQEISKPIIGYYGAIAEWFDTKILEQLCQSQPHVSIVLIGRVTNDEVLRISQTYENVHLLGEKPYSQLPSYLSCFDVCIIPFVLNDLIKATHPIKFFEFLAAGKPIVTTPLPEILQYKKHMYVGRTPEQFSKQVSKALNERISAERKKRQAIALANTWDSIGKTMVEHIQSLLFSKVSIIILSYNNVGYTKKCIESVYERSLYPNLEVIVVDNGSDAPTVSELKKLRQRFSFVCILNKKNLGFSEGNNIGIRKATGEFIILMNNDTLVVPGWVERLVFYAKKHGVGLVGPVTNHIGNEMMITIHYDELDRENFENTVRAYTSLHWGETREREDLAAFCWIMPRMTVKKIGEFDRRFGQALFEDDDYCVRVKKAGLKILGIEDAFVHHYGSKTLNHIQQSAYKKLFEKNRKLFEEKWGVTWQRHKRRGAEESKKGEEHED